MTQMSDVASGRQTLPENAFGLRQRQMLALLLGAGALLTGGFALLVLLGKLPGFSGGETAAVMLLIALVLGLVAIGVVTDQVRFRGADEAAVLAASWNALPAALAVVRRDGRVLAANEAYRALARRAGRRLVAPEHVFAGMPDVAAVIYRMQQRLGKAGVIGEEVHLPAGNPLRQDGRPGWLRITAHLFETEGKACELWQVVDVSAERRRQERAMARLEESVRVLDELPVGLVVSEDDGRVMHINATLARWLGIDPLALRPGQLSLQEVLPAELVARLTLARVAAGEEAIIEQPAQLHTADGSMLSLRVLHRVRREENGAAGQAQTVLLPAVERETPAREEFERLIASAPVGVALVDGEGRVDFVNAVLARSAGERLAVGAEITPLVAAQDRQRLEAALNTVLRGERAQMALDVFLFDGNETRAQITINRGPGRGATLFVIDTSLKQTLMEQIEHGQIMQQIGIMATQLAHDFNNLLTPIIGSADILLQRLRVTDPSYELVHNIKSHSWEAAKIVEQLLAFSRRQTLQPQVISVNDWLVREVKLLRAILKKGNVQLKTVYDADWPIKVDPRKLDRVVVNLVRNAEDAMPEGGTITIRTRNVPACEIEGRMAEVMAMGDYVLIEVEDTGEGIPPEIMDKIFEPFYTTKPTGKGTGLGLATVYGIVKQSGGYVFCDSTVGVGTTFRIYLPRHVETEEELRRRRKEEEARARLRRRDLTGSGVVLLVEDEISVREFAVKALQMRGYTVIEAESAEIALDIMEERLAAGNGVDLIVSDVVMPGMDGPRMVAELRSMGVNAPVVFMSGHAEDAFARNLDEDLAFVFLSKPFDLRTIAEAVKEALSGGGRKRAVSEADRKS